MTYEFDRTGLVPPHIDFELFEDNNPVVKLNVYTENPEKKGTVKTLYFSKNDNGTRLIEVFLDEENEHFSAVSRKSALLREQLGGRCNKAHFCSRCNKAHKSEEARDKHQELCYEKKKVIFKARDKNTGEVPKIKFRNIAGLSRCPFVGSADSEDFLRPMYRLKGNTKLIQEHNASCWGCLLMNPDEIEYFDCYSKNPTREFVKELMKRAGKLFENYWEPVIKTNLKKCDNNDIPIDEIIKDESIDFSCRYFLKIFFEGERDAKGPA